MIQFPSFAVLFFSFLKGGGDVSLQAINLTLLLPASFQLFFSRKLKTDNIARLMKCSYLER